MYASFTVEICKSECTNTAGHSPLYYCPCLCVIALGRNNLVGGRSLFGSQFKGIQSMVGKSWRLRWPGTAEAGGVTSSPPPHCSGSRELGLELRPFPSNLPLPVRPHLLNVIISPTSTTNLRPWVRTLHGPAMTFLTWFPSSSAKCSQLHFRSPHRHWSKVQSPF